MFKKTCLFFISILLLVSLVVFSSEKMAPKHEGVRLIDGEGVTISPSIIKNRKQVKKSSQTKHDMSYHYYHEGRYFDGEDLAAKLVYEDDIPILKITSDDEYLAGKAIGDLTFNAIFEFHNKYIPLFKLLLRKDSIFKNPIKHTLQVMDKQNIVIPENIKSEMRGIVDRYNEIITELNQNRSRLVHYKKIDFQEFLVWSVITDVYKGIGGCSATIKRNNEGKVELYRNLDWESLGILGKTSLVIVRPFGKYHTASIAVALPQLGLSVANNEGLVVTLNEAATGKTNRNFKGGIPEAFLSREIVENCRTLDEVLAYIKTHPLASSHSLAIRDRYENGAVVQMLPPGEEALYTVRPLSDEEESFVVVTNHHFDSEGEVNFRSRAFGDSEYRYYKMEDAMKNGESPANVLSSVNADDSIQSMMFTEDDSGKLILRLLFDNSYSAAGRYRTCKIDDLFEQVE